MSEDCKKEKTKKYPLQKEYEEINQLAIECYELYHSPDLRKTKYWSIFENKLNKLYTTYHNTMMKRFSQYPKTEEIIPEVFASQWGYKNQLVSVNQTWDPERVPFAQGSIYLIKKRLFGDTPPVSVPPDEPEPQKNDEPVTTDTPLNTVILNDTLENIFRVMNDAVQVKVRQSGGAVCYTKLCYTELVARLLNRTEMKFITPDKCIPAKTTERIDLDFADSFLDKEIKTLPDMRDAPLKSLSCFTKSAADQYTPCKYPLQAAVYMEYVQQKTGNRPVDSTISEHRSKFKKLSKSIIGLDLFS